MKKLIIFSIAAMFVICIGMVSRDFLLTLSVAALSGGTLYLLMEKNESENEKIADFFILLAMVLIIIIIKPIVAGSISKSLIALIGSVILIPILWLSKRLFRRRKS